MPDSADGRDHDGGSKKKEKSRRPGSTSSPGASPNVQLGPEIDTDD